MKSRRFWFVAVLAALLVVGVAIGNASAKSTAVKGASASAGAAVWFCPGPPPSLHNLERVTFSNVGDDPSDVVVTDLTDEGDSVRHTLTVGAHQVVTRARPTLGGPGSLTIETFGGRVVVEDAIEGPALVESSLCASQAENHAYFAAGSTLRGVQQWLVIDNPYAADARVDVTFFTTSGVRKPDDLQGLDISRRSRFVVAVHSSVVREPRVAVAVDTEVGSVVTGQTLVYTRDAGRPGVAMSLGAPAASDDWMFAGGIAQADADVEVAIAAVGDSDAQVDVQAITGTSQIIQPASITVTEGTVAWVQIGHCPTGAAARSCVNVPDAARYALDVRADGGVPVVAQILGRYDDPEHAVGAVTALGQTHAAQHWLFARSRVAGERMTTLAFFNPSAAAAHVDIALVHNGRIDRPRALQAVALAPGRRTTVTVASSRNASAPDAAIMIDADSPVFVERSVVAAGGSVRSVGFAAG